MKLFSASALLLLFLFFPRYAVGQTASISGTVKDTTAAVVPQVKVTARSFVPELRAIRARHYSLCSTLEKMRRLWVRCRQPLPWDYFMLARHTLTISAA
jgi:hypothetical protein